MDETTFTGSWLIAVDGYVVPTDFLSPNFNVASLFGFPSNELDEIVSIRSWMKVVKVYVGSNDFCATTFDTSFFFWFFARGRGWNNFYGIFLETITFIGLGN